MSRIGKQPISLPKGVTVELENAEVAVKGPKGQLTQRIPADMSIAIDDGILNVKRPSDQREHRALHGLTRALINNMVVGVSEGFTRKLQIEGVGYRAEMDGKNLVLMVGYSHPVVMEPPADVSFDV